MKNQKFEIAGTRSRIEWVGRKVTGSHNGTINVKNGELILNDGKIAGGRFTFDTTSIDVLDITDPDTKAQFTGHLTSDDFFSSQNYPEASFEITSATGNHVVGNLTIKGITHPVAFDTEVIVGDGLLTATARVVVDRTKYDMKFRSGSFFQNLGDTLIFNDFDLYVSIIAKEVNKILSR